MKCQFCISSLFLTYTLASSLCFASGGNRVGNGGNAIICRKTKVTGLFDFRENQQSKSLKLISTKNTEAGVHIAIERLSKISPRWSQALKRSWKSIHSRIEWKTGIDITQAHDSFHSDLPEGCALKQVAIRREKPLNAQKDFVFDRELFDKLAKVDQAGLLVHEMLYEYLHKLGANDSRGVRAINRVLFSAEFDRKALSTVIAQMRLPEY